MKKLLSLQAGLGLFLTIVIFLSGILGCGVLVCMPPPAAPCEIETLLVDEAIFPEEWKQQGIPTSRAAPASFGVERIGTSFSTRTRGVGVQAVYRALNMRTAATGYRDFMSYFSVREGEMEWVLPAELTWHSQVADQFHLGCSIHRASGVQRCQFIGQYDVYLTRLHVYMSSDLMTYEDLKRILRNIDRRMAECLGQ